MKVVVTGITGFVGQNLSNYFSNEKVVGVSRTKSEGNVAYDEVPQALHDADAFVHLAGKAHDLKKTSSDQEYYTVNRDLTIQLFNQFLESNCPVFIYMSSVKAVADVVEESELTEDAIANPVTAYGKSKKEAEEYILKQTIPSGKYVYILRPCMIHGPLNKGNLDCWYQFVAK